MFPPMGDSMDVVFAVLPFANVARPAIGVSILKAELARRGVSACVEYLNIDLAEQIGLEPYQTVSDQLLTELLVGEWFFADVVFGDSIPHASDYVARVLAPFRDASVERVIEARRYRHAFVESCVARIAALHPKVVGFTTTFHQTCASLAVARRLKESMGADAPIVMFGGANCEGEMGWQMGRSFPWIDYVCTGEGDVVAPEFIARLVSGGDRTPPAGIVPAGLDAEPTTPQAVADLDSVAIPDYHDYTARIAASPLGPVLRTRLSIETSRGCWWGAKQHCTFCGLNGETMAYRSKSPERVFDELKTLSTTYGITRIDCVDNILDMRYIGSLFPRLAAEGTDLELFYEVKANLRYDQLAALRAGGVRAIQPGIESFSSAVLTRMRKGCTGLQNVQLLRWCDELDIAVHWNILAGFPGESPDDYARMAELLPRLTHLGPPMVAAPVRLDRYSMFFVQPDAFDLTKIRPAPAYYYCFPLGRGELARLAYFFDFDYADGRRPWSYLADVAVETRRWGALHGQAAEHRPRLDASFGGDEVVVRDTRPVATAPRHVLTGLAARVYLRCDTAQRVDGAARALDVEESDVRDVVASLVAANLMIEMDGHVLSLAVFRDRPTAPISERNGRSHQTQAPDPVLSVV